MAIQRDPLGFAKMIAGLMPKEVLVATMGLTASINLDEVKKTQGVLEAFRLAVELLGTEEEIEAEHQIELDNDDAE